MLRAKRISAVDAYIIGMYRIMQMPEQENRKNLYDQLAAEALNRLPMSYTPYSHFHVAAALLTKDGRVYGGSNIENAAYTPTVCAERTAFFKAVSEGERQFRAIAIAGGKESLLEGESWRVQKMLPAYVPPCGVCRQVMREFCDPETFDILLVRSPKDYKVYKLKELLPEGFGPENL